MRFVPALRFFRRDATSRNEPDPADLGTAFGLDACLDDGGVSEYRSQPVVEALESQASRASIHDSPLGWLSRRAV